MNRLSQVDVQRINEVPTWDIDWSSMFVKDCKLLEDSVKYNKTPVTSSKPKGVSDKFSFLFPD